MICRFAFEGPLQGHVVAPAPRTLNDESLIQFAEGARRFGVTFV
jgi:hypothetical protein